MLPASLLRWFLGLVVAGNFAAGARAADCVWKVTGEGGKTLYLGGSVHALRSVDYPLPEAFNHAFDASSRLAFEVDPKALQAASAGFAKAGVYPKGDSLKNHVDPRTYDYVRRVLGLMKIPETKFARLRPWYLVLLLQSPGVEDYSDDLGVESFLYKRAVANSKPIAGLESAREHAQVFSGLNDRQSEALLLITFIPRARGGDGNADVLKAWRRGDADLLSRAMRASYRDFPAFSDRLLEARNRNWIPKIEGYLRSGQTCFVVAGAAHMGGANGVPALLRARGYKVEQE